MPNIAQNGSTNVFARAFGAALQGFLREAGMSQVDLAAKLGLTDKKSGKPSKSRLNTYLSDTPPMPGAEVLYLACTKLEGFQFYYNGYRISAETVSGNGSRPATDPAAQLPLRFDRQFNLTDDRGIVTEKGAFSVRLKRPSGRIELSLSVTAAKSH